MDFLPKAKNTHSPTTDQQKRMRKLCRKLMDYPVFQFRKNAKYKVAEIMLMAIDAAMENQSLEAVSSIRGGMSADDALLHLKDKLGIEKIEQMLFELLDQRFLKILRRKFPCFRKWIAIDFTPEMFYGDKNCEYVTGYEPKDGTYYCFKFMTVSLLLPEGKYLLFAYPCYCDTDKIWLLNRAYEFLAGVGITAELCLMDREFYTVDVLALCREQKMHYIIPAKHDSKFERYVKQMEKLPGLVRGYEIMNEHGESEWTNLVVMESEWKEKKEIFGFITNLPENWYRDDTYAIAEIYRKRWRLETAHRVHDCFRIRTCCKEGSVRYFFFVIAVLLYNLWVWINLMLTDCHFGEYKVKMTVFGMKKMVVEPFLENRRRVPTRIAI